jgi:hypothetical protein
MKNTMKIFIDLMLLIGWAAVTNLSYAGNKLLVLKYGFERKTDPGEAPDTNLYLAPVTSKFEIMDEIKDPDKGTLLVVRFSSVAERTFAKKGVKAFYVSRLSGHGNINQAPLVSMGINYILPKEALPQSDYEIGSGVEVGVLTIPFRMQLTDGELSAGGSLGGYAGYRTKVFGVTTSFIGAAGLSFVPISNINSSHVDTKTGVTLAFGIIFVLAPPAQIGFILGTDMLGSTSYQYNGKGWITFSVGYAFTQ